eukprot:Platyproteum_vivax@DN12704_c0_g1_i1.p1
MDNIYLYAHTRIEKQRLPTADFGRAATKDSAPNYSPEFSKNTLDSREFENHSKSWKSSKESFEDSNYSREISREYSGEYSRDEKGRQRSSEDLESESSDERMMDHRRQRHFHDHERTLERRISPRRTPTFGQIEPMEDLETRRRRETESEQSNETLSYHGSGESEEAERRGPGKRQDSAELETRRMEERRPNPRDIHRDQSKDFGHESHGSKGARQQAEESSEKSSEEMEARRQEPQPADSLETPETPPRISNLGKGGNSAEENQKHLNTLETTGRRRQSFQEQAQTMIEQCRQQAPDLESTYT